MKNFDSLRNIFGGGYYLERRDGTGLLVPPRLSEIGGLRWRNISDLGGVG